MTGNTQGMTFRIKPPKKLKTRIIGSEVARTPLTSITSYWRIAADVWAAAWPAAGDIAADNRAAPNCRACSYLAGTNCSGTAA